MKPFLAALLMAACLPLCAIAALNPNDTSYLNAEMQSQLGRYAIAALAKKNGASASVQRFAKALAQQSSAATRELDAIAKSSGVPAAKHLGTRDAYHYSQLQGLHGKAFDRRFILDVKVDDELMMTRDQNAAHNVKSSALRSFAQHHSNVLSKELKRLSAIHT